MSTTALNPFGEIFVIGAGKLPAALFTTMSSWPKRSMIPPTIRCTAAGVADVADVEVHLDVLGAQLGRRCFEPFRLPARDRDARAVMAEHPADLLSDSGRATRDECDRTRQDVRTERRPRQFAHLCPLSALRSGRSAPA